MSLRTLTCSVAVVAIVLGAGLGSGVAVAQDGDAAAVERVVLPANVQPVRYEITIRPDLEAMTFEGKTAAHFEVVEATDVVVMNAFELNIDEARLRGDNGPVPTVDYDEARQQVSFTFAAPLQPGAYTLDMAYTGQIRDEAKGLFAGRYTENGEPRAMMVSQMEPGDARRASPMWDEPAIKAIFEVSMVVADDEEAVSNMPVASTRSNRDGTKTVRFEPTPKMSSYLLFFASGDLERVTGSVGGVETATVTRAGDAEKGRYALGVLDDLLPWYGEYFGVEYSLPKLDQIAVPGAGDFGAMENWGAILYFDNYLLLDPTLSTEKDRQTVYAVVAHEVAHQWFGNLVTMAWWDDLWLNEGFASWMENKATDHFNPDWDIWLQAQASQDMVMGQDSFISTHPIVQPIRDSLEAEEAFDGITYQKGQAVIRMLEDFVGEGDFRQGVRDYMAAHPFGNSTTGDLWNALEGASGEPIRAVANDFVNQPGVPLITVGETQCEGGWAVTALTQTRFGSDEESKAAPLTWRTPVVAQSLGSATPGRTVVENGKGSVTSEGCGPVKVNAGGAGYFRTLYSEAHRDALEAGFGQLPPADQLNLLYDAWALGHADYQPTTEYLDLADRVGAESDPVVQMQVADTLVSLAQLYEGQAGEAAFGSWSRGRLSAQLRHRLEPARGRGRQYRDPEEQSDLVPVEPGRSRGHCRGATQLCGKRHARGNAAGAGRCRGASCRYADLRGPDGSGVGERQSARAADISAGGGADPGCDTGASDADAGLHGIDYPAAVPGGAGCAGQQRH